MKAFLRRSIGLGLLLSAVTPCFASVTDPKNGDLDVRGVEVKYDGSQFSQPWGSGTAPGRNHSANASTPTGRTMS